MCSRGGFFVRAPLMRITSSQHGSHRLTILGGAMMFQWLRREKWLGQYA